MAQVAEVVGVAKAECVTVTVGLEVAINLARKPTLVACEQLEQEAFADVEKLRRALLCFSRRCPPSCDLLSQRHTAGRPSLWALNCGLST